MNKTLKVPCVWGKRTRHIEPNDNNVEVMGYGRIVQIRDYTSMAQTKMGLWMAVLAFVIHCAFVQRSAIRGLNDTFRDVVEVFLHAQKDMGPTSPLATRTSVHLG